MKPSWLDFIHDTVVFSNLVAFLLISINLNSSMDDVWEKLPILTQTSTAAPLKFGNG